MGLMETEETNKFTFEAFASHPFYTEVNHSLVQQALSHFKTQPTKKPLTIVDMACGTGAITRLIAEEMAQFGRKVRLIGVDPSAEALRRAEKFLGEIGAKAEFIQGEAEDLPRIVRNADAAFFCNAIHLVPDKYSAFQQIASILASGGIFACNSAFYEGTYVEGTDRFYHLWIFRALRWLRQEHPEIRLARKAKAMAMQWLTADIYVDLLKKAGFNSVETVLTDVKISLDAWKDLGRYWLFIEGALPGAPLAYGSAALEKAVYQAGEELGVTEVPRTWLQVVATKS
jgi:ubiquinone/menaquinone biosynthesis C-methylase UbiE